MKHPGIDYILHLADNALVLGHRNSEWCGHGPVLEQDIAITNISLDLIGQARNFYQYAAKLIGSEATEDSLAYLRNADEFKNCLMVELPKGDWAFTILRQFYFSSYQFLLFTELMKSRDEQLAAIAEKSIKEVTYHLRWSSEWVIRLGNGTEESKKRLEKAAADLGGYIAELFEPAVYEKGIASLSDQWEEKRIKIFLEAGLDTKNTQAKMVGGKEGKHTEHLDHILKDLQYLQRAYPGAEW